MDSDRHPVVRAVKMLARCLDQRWRVVVVRAGLALEHLFDPLVVLFAVMAQS